MPHNKAIHCAKLFLTDIDLCVNTLFINWLWCFEFSLLGYNYQPLGYNFQPLGYNYQIKAYHWGITTSLVVIPQSNPLNLPRTGIQVANIVRGKTKCYICHKTLIKSCILSYKQSGSVLSVLLYFTLTKASTKYSSLAILTHLLTIFFDKMCQ